MSNKVNIVILNWNGAEDTIECLESLRYLTDVDYRVTVCDNDSSDDSLRKIAAWADERQLSWQQIVPNEATSTNYPKLTLINNGDNLGFSGGNNIGIAYALTQSDVGYVWLLNNDTVVEPDALSKLVQRVKQDETIGICGSLIKFYDNRSVIQAVGGCSMNPFTGIASQSLGRYLPDYTVLDQYYYEKQMDYVSGASMLVTRLFLEEVGLMDESYFLYYEEVDWAVRGFGRFRQGIAIDSVVYHKEGRSIGSASLDRPASPVSEFYLTRSKFRFMSKHFAMLLPVTFAATCLQALNRLRRGQWQAGSAIMKAAMGLPMAEVSV